MRLIQFYVILAISIIYTSQLQAEVVIARNGKYSAYAKVTSVNSSDNTYGLKFLGLTGTYNKEEQIVSADQIAHTTGCLDELCVGDEIEIRHGQDSVQYAKVAGYYNRPSWTTDGIYVVRLWNVFYYKVFELHTISRRHIK